MTAPAYTIILMMNTRPEWLALTPDQRETFNDAHVNPIFARYAETVSARLFDAEAFTGFCTDFVLFETHDLMQYYFLMEELRETPLFSVPYFEVKEIVMGLEGGFEAFAEMVKGRSAAHES